MPAFGDAKRVRFWVSDEDVFSRIAIGLLTTGANDKGGCLGRGFALVLGFHVIGLGIDGEARIDALAASAGYDPG